VRCTKSFAPSQKTSNSALSRNGSLIFWKPRPPNLILQVCSVWSKRRNPFANSVLARMADC
jgi:hypothetical protein